MLYVIENIVNSNIRLDSLLPHSLINNSELVCLSNDARKRMCCLFTPTGAIANERDFAAFQRKFPRLPPIREVPRGMVEALRRPILRTECYIVAIQQGVVMFPDAAQAYGLYAAIQAFAKFAKEQMKRPKQEIPKIIVSFVDTNIEHEIHVVPSQDNNRNLSNLNNLNQTIYISPESSIDTSNDHANDASNEASMNEDIQTDSTSEYNTEDEEADSAGDTEAGEQEDSQSRMSSSTQLLEQFFSSKSIEQKNDVENQQEPSPSRTRSGGFWGFFGF